MQQVRQAEDEGEIGEQRDVVEPLVRAEHRPVLDDDRTNARQRAGSLRGALPREEAERSADGERARPHQAVYPPSTNTVEPVT